jgi:hypothetical protein
MIEGAWNDSGGIMVDDGMRPIPKNMKIKIDSGEPSGMPYSKVDAWKMSKIGNDFAFSAYQFDYQFLIDSLEAKDKGSQENMEFGKGASIPVGRFVMNPDGFERFKTEFLAFIAKIEKGVTIQK